MYGPFDFHSLHLHCPDCDVAWQGSRTDPCWQCGKSTGVPVMEQMKAPHSWYAKDNDIWPYLDLRPPTPETQTSAQN